MYRAAFSDRIDELEEFFLAHDDGEQFDSFSNLPNCTQLGGFMFSYFSFFR